MNRAPKDTTWAALHAAQHPTDVTTEAAQTHRFGPFETTAWRIRGTVTSVRLMPDHDFYLTVTDKHGDSGIVEIPDPTLCAGSPLLGLMQAARDALDAKYHPTAERRTVNDPITVIGVGFFGWANPGDPGSAATSRLMPGIGVTFGG